jgi:hypothetical protein
MTKQLDIRTVLIRWFDEQTPYEVDVVVGDGLTQYDSDFEFDERIYFYFHNEAEFESAKTDYLPNINFRIVGETN